MARIVKTRDDLEMQEKRTKSRARNAKKADKASRLSKQKFSQLNPNEKDELLEELFIRFGLCEEG